ncbi:metal-dependent hydrolase [Parendozoicomonas sp. Alg238-R29]|uniref:metal-dependent hydrolase n=1 Tax=Parendozoicomonas sp. Alg238-R29 TaxID=2993446 RepID=UPI00248EA662|nr:metal-dependent hydrolase [Parendozoicomonas sp. Alg238-R29]
MINNKKHEVQTLIDQANDQPDIKPRRMSFPFKRMKANLYFDDNSLKSSFIAALSATFPPGEAEFIASVRNYRDQIKDPKLQEQIRGFIGQEGHHSHQHKQVNETLSNLGWDAARLEHSFQRELDKRIHKFSNRFRLAMTVGMEHLTAILAEHILENPEKLAPMEPEARHLLYWHAVEEIEHKAVAFDVFMTCDGDQKYLRKILKIGRILFVLRISAYMIAMHWWARKFPGWREIKGFGSFLWGKDGVITSLKQPFRDYFKPGFHPWDHANQHLIDKWKNDFYHPEFDKGSEQYIKPDDGPAVQASPV